MTIESPQEFEIAEFAQRAEIVGQYINGWIESIFGQSANRDLVAQFRYPKITQERLESIYRHGNLAHRIGKLLPEQTWGDDPVITDNPERDDKSALTDFEKDIRFLIEEHDLIGWLRKADEVMAYADYVAMRLQIADGTNAMEPYAKIPGRKGRPEALTFITVHSAEYATFAAGSEDRDMNSRNYGRPTIYNLQPNVSNREIYGASAIENLSVPVHYSKIVHMAENLDENNLVGYSRLRAIFYILYDLQKIMASASESYYQGARNPYVQVINAAAKALSGNSAMNYGKTEGDIADKAIRALKEEFTDSVTVQNADIKALNPAVASPKDAGELAFDLVSAGTGIPKEWLKGNVAGLRSSETNASIFGKLIENRQRNFVNPVMIRPLIKKLIAMGIVSRPKDDRFEIQWAPIVQMSEKDKMAAWNQFCAGAKSMGHTPSNPIFTHEQIAEKAGLPYMKDELQKQKEEAQKEAEEAMKKAQEAMGGQNGMPNPADSNAPEDDAQADSGNNNNNDENGDQK